MTPFTHHTGKAVALPEANIDTDQLIPARFMSRTRAEGYGLVLLHDQRHDAQGKPLADHPLNQESAEGVSILVTGRNLGTGSSREAAVYALADFGIRCVVAASFGDIFAANAVKNGLLPARVSAEDNRRLLDHLADHGPAETTVDLERRQITLGPMTIAFEIDPAWREQLLNGWDDIDLTLRHAGTIARWTARDRANRPWSVPATPDKSG
ncbi:MAG: 3-isopropylmalate dehydratase small subunit [Azospirillaceae bacterium]